MLRLRCHPAKVSSWWHLAREESMVSTNRLRILLLAAFAAVLSACAGEEGAQSSDTASDTSIYSETTDTGEVTGASSDTMAFTHKMMRSTGENQFAALAYECPQCTFEQWLAIVPPEGWTKGPAQVSLHSSGELRSTPTFEGVPDTMDFIDEIPGNEYQLIAKNLDARLIEVGENGLVVEAQVMRDTLLRFDADRRVHELGDPDGNVFVLFAYEVDPTDIEIPDFEDPDVLGDFTAPEGWTYSSRILEEELELDTSDIATVLAIRSGVTSTWEMRSP